MTPPLPSMARRTLTWSPLVEPVALSRRADVRPAGKVLPPWRRRSRTCLRLVCVGRAGCRRRRASVKARLRSARRLSGTPSRGLAPSFFVSGRASTTGRCFGARTEVACCARALRARKTPSSCRSPRGARCASTPRLCGRAWRRPASLCPSFAGRCTLPRSQRTLSFATLTGRQPGSSCSGRSTRWFRSRRPTWRRALRQVVVASALVVVTSTLHGHLTPLDGRTARRTLAKSRPVRPASRCDHRTPSFFKVVCRRRTRVSRRRPVTQSAAPRTPPSRPWRHACDATFCRAPARLRRARCGRARRIGRG